MYHSGGAAHDRDREREREIANAHTFLIILFAFLGDAASDGRNKPLGFTDTFRVQVAVFRHRVVGAFLLLKGDDECQSLIGLQINLNLDRIRGSTTQGEHQGQTGLKRPQ